MEALLSDLPALASGPTSEMDIGDLFYVGNVDGFIPGPDEFRETPSFPEQSGKD